MAQYLGLIVVVVLILRRHDLNILSLFFTVKIKSSWKEFISVNRDIFIRTICLIFVLSFFKTQAGSINPILGAANILLLEFITLSAYGIDGFAFAAESITGKYFGERNKISFLLGIGESY